MKIIVATLFLPLFILMSVYNLIFWALGCSGSSIKIEMGDKPFMPFEIEIT